jgi:membrane fusion protein (multidrug efflux system)
MSLHAGAATLAVMLVVTGCSSAEKEAAGATANDDETVVVEAANAETRSLEQTIEVSTTLAPSHTLRVTPEVGGVAEKLYVDQGDTVEAGDPLVRIGSPNYSLQVDSAQSQKAAAEAGLKQAKAQLETAKKQLERFEKLYEQDVVAKSQFEEVETAYERAKAGYESAEARAEQASVGIEQAREQVEDTTVRAPFDGHVVRRMVDEGSVLRPMASPVMVLIDDDPIRAEGSVSELHLPNIEKGMEATVTLDAYPDRAFDGELTMVNRQVQPRTREAAVRVELTNDSGDLRAGMSGQLTLEVGSRERVVIPRNAIFEREGKKATVYVIESDRARRREIEIEPGFTAEYPVREGLSAGDRIVTWGGKQLRDGARVEVRSGDDTDPSGDAADDSDNRGGTP